MASRPARAGGGRAAWLLVSAELRTALTPAVLVAAVAVAGLAALTATGVYGSATRTDSIVPSSPADATVAGMVAVAAWQLGSLPGVLFVALVGTAASAGEFAHGMAGLARSVRPGAATTIAAKVAAAVLVAGATFLAAVALSLVALAAHGDRPPVGDVGRATRALAGLPATFAVVSAIAVLVGVTVRTEIASLAATAGIVVVPLLLADIGTLAPYTVAYWIGDVMGFRAADYPGGFRWSFDPALTSTVAPIAVLVAVAIAAAALAAWTLAARDVGPSDDA